jgi:hypothetical protein
MIGTLSYCCTTIQMEQLFRWNNYSEPHSQNRIFDAFLLLIEATSPNKN